VLVAADLLVSAASAAVPVTVTPENPDFWLFTRDTATLPSVQNHYGYITVRSINMTLDGTDAEIALTYEIDPWMSFLVFLFGKQDLKDRLLKIINYPEANPAREQVITYKYVDNTRAVIDITNAALSYGDNSYWYSAHAFRVEVPEFIIQTPSGDRNYTNIREMDRGFGFFVR
jgi:hypothetical protein